MQSCGKRVTSAVLTAAVASLSLLVVGCEKDSADLRVHKAIKESVQTRTTQTENHIDAAIQLLGKTIGEQEASPASKALSRAALGQAELDSANISMVELQAKESEITRTIIQIHNLLGQVSRGNTLLAGFQKTNPSATVTSLNQAIAELRGGEGKDIWITHEKGKIRSQAGLKADETRLKGEIDKLKNEIKTLGEQRAKALADSNEADSKSLAAKGQESVDLYKNGSNLRKTAADLQNQIDVATLKLIPFEDELKVVTAQLEVADKTIAAYEQQIADVQKGWTDTQAKIAEQQTIIKNLVEGKSPAAAADVTPGPGLTISEKAATITTLAADAAKLRDTAERRLNDSIQHFNDAAGAADDLRTRLQKLASDERYQGKPEATEAWKKLQEAVDAGGYRLQQGEAERAKAELYTGQSLTALARINLFNVAKPILDAAKVKSPAELDTAGLESEMQKSREAADAMYQSASQRFQNIFDGTSTNDRKNAALVQRMLTMYEWSQLAAATNDKSVASQHLSAAVEARDQAITANARLPILPADIAPAPAPRTPTPAPGASPTAPTAPASPGASSPAAPAAPAAPGGFDTPPAAPPATPPPAAAPATPAAPAEPATPEAPAPKPATPAAPAQPGDDAFRS